MQYEIQMTLAATVDGNCLQSPQLRALQLAPLFCGAVAAITLKSILLENISWMFNSFLEVSKIRDNNTF
jgi:hypothetical protein